jgi:hypothetical protein
MIVTQSTLGSVLAAFLEAHFWTMVVLAAMAFSVTVTFVLLSVVMELVVYVWNTSWDEATESQSRGPKHPPDIM